MPFAFCILPVAPIRAKPAHEAEMSSQLLFGEQVEIISTSINGFVEIKCIHDGYTGFCSINQLIETHQVVMSSNSFAGNWVNAVYDAQGHCLRIPFGSSLPEELRSHFDFSSICKREILAFNKDNLAEIISIFINSPYLWGGRSVYGLDCSGFTQAIARSFGVNLFRDAWQQAGVGHEVSFDKHREGDLAFFTLQEKIVHVGIITAFGEITHAFGKIRKDDLTEEGIINRDTGIRTHLLNQIKRIF